MENLLIEKQIAFLSMDYSDANQVEKLKINITSTDLDNIKKAMRIVRDNDFISSVKIDIDGFVGYVDDLDEEVDWRADVEQFIVYSDCVYYYAQNKWHSGDQIESDSIERDELGIKVGA